VWSPLMKQVVAGLTEDDMLDLSAYVASLGR
jgi:cytochrome c553